MAYKKLEYDLAMKYIEAGGSIKAIQNKYKLTAVQEKQLNGQTKSTKKA